MTTDKQSTSLRDRKKPDAYYSYGGLSVLLHWATVFMVAALALSAGQTHVALSVVFALLLLWRSVRRWGKGFPRVSDQLLVLNFIERAAKIIMLIALIVLVLSGIMQALFLALPLTFFGLATWQPPIEPNPTGALIAATIHGYGAWALYGAIAIHLLAALKHFVTMKDGIILRIVKPVAGGK